MHIKCGTLTVLTTISIHISSATQSKLWIFWARSLASCLASGEQTFEHYKCFIFSNKTQMLCKNIIYGDFWPFVKIFSLGGPDVLLGSFHALVVDSFRTCQCHRKDIVIDASALPICCMFHETLLNCLRNIPLLTIFWQCLLK